MLINLSELTFDKDDMEDLSLTETYERMIISRCAESKNGNFRSNLFW